MQPSFPAHGPERFVERRKSSVQLTSRDTPPGTIPPCPNLARARLAIRGVTVPAGCSLAEESCSCSVIVIVLERGDAEHEHEHGAPKSRN